MTELSALNFSEGFFRTSGRNGDIFQVALYQLDMKLDQLKVRTDGVGQQVGRSRVGYAESLWQKSILPQALLSAWL